MCLACCDADKKAKAMQENECDGNHKPFITFNQLKADVTKEYFKLNKSKTHFRMIRKGIIDPPSEDYILGITHSLEGNHLPAKESVRISFV